MSRCWYAYTGTGDPSSCSNFVRINGKPGSLNGCKLSTIYVPSCGINPTCPLSANILTYIANLLASCVAQPQVPAGTKFYVYGKAD